MRKRRGNFRGKRFLYCIESQNEVGKKRVGPGIITGRFGWKYALVQFTWPYYEVDIEDMRPENSLFGTVGFDGALTSHIPDTKSPP